ncbi:YdcF family protein [Dyadobacter pollutisoli]|uniref:YdcF family protein n=1 Tax=Dyadobacter pollutisoli TaxID=2910158 RepID=A0A9E8NCQ4_9BACT|nr:YdcF family protein [Dyadobacter pollutisoli]WAC12898.1 YdcF family protein [Dyadobacter pollutisoli]
MLYRSADKAFQKGLENQPYDAVIVPGFPYNGQKWDMVLQMRIHWANYLYTRGYTKNIIFSGSAVATPYVESKVMASYAQALGIPREHLFTEEKAEHSTENVYYSYRLAKDLGFSKIALATDPVQTSYMRKFIKRFELPIGLMPTVIDTLKVLNLYEPKIDPKPTMKEGFVKLSDREGFFQRFRGTMGKYIVWHEEDLKKKKHRRKFKDRMIPTSSESKNHKSVQ